MSVLITNTTVVTCDVGRRIHYGAALVVEGERIAEIGPSGELEARYPGAERVDGRGKVVFPGLVNCHTHLLATADRGILEDFGFPTTLRFPTTGRGLLDEDGRNVFGLLGDAGGDSERDDYDAGDLERYSVVCGQSVGDGYAAVPR